MIWECSANGSLQMNPAWAYAYGMNMMTDNYSVENRLSQLERMYRPQMGYPMQQQTQVITVGWVEGIDGARSYPVRFGGTVLLIDPNANMMYLKVVDQIGTTKISPYTFSEAKMPSGSDTSGEVTALAGRITRLEEIILSMSSKEAINVQAVDAEVKEGSGSKRNNAGNVAAVPASPGNDR